MELFFILFGLFNFLMILSVPFLVIKSTPQKQDPIKDIAFIKRWEFLRSLQQDANKSWGNKDH